MLDDSAFQFEYIAEYFRRGVVARGFVGHRLVAARRKIPIAFLFRYSAFGSRRTSIAIC